MQLRPTHRGTWSNFLLSREKALLNFWEPQFRRIPKFCVKKYSVWCGSAPTLQTWQTESPPPRCCTAMNATGGERSTTARELPRPAASRATVFDSPCKQSRNKKCVDE